MAKFKVHLLAEDGRIVGERVFNAVRNYEAIEMAQRLCSAAADKCKGFDLWRGDRKITRRFPI